MIDVHNIFLGKTAVEPCHKRARNRRKKTLATNTLSLNTSARSASSKEIDALFPINGLM